MTDDGAASQHARVAAVQAAPVFLDREASIEKAVRLVHQAGESGAGLIAFPEGFVPGHPGWVELLPFNATAQELAKSLFLQAVELEAGHLEPVQQACREAKLTAVLGLCERRPGTTGTLFNTQVHISGAGDITCHHQKFVPTVGERLVHAPGTTGAANSSRWAHGTVTSLICGENSHPLAQYASALAYPTVHVASWPQHFSPELGMADALLVASRGLAYSLKCFVVNAVSPVSAEMKEAYGVGAAHDYLDTPGISGRASVIAPWGEVIAQAPTDEEQLLVVDVDPEAVLIPKMFHDVAGHYNRPDLFAHLFSGPHRAD